MFRKFKLSLIYSSIPGASNLAILIFSICFFHNFFKQTFCHLTPAAKELWEKWNNLRLGQSSFRTTLVTPRICYLTFWLLGFRRAETILHLTERLDCQPQFGKRDKQDSREQRKSSLCDRRLRYKEVTIPWGYWTWAETTEDGLRQDDR